MSWTFWKSKKSPVKPEAKPVDRSPVLPSRRQPAPRGGHCHDEPRGGSGPGSPSKPSAGRFTDVDADGPPTCCGGGAR